MQPQHDAHNEWRRAQAQAALTPRGQVMTSMEEFSFIAAQLEWLQGHLRSQAPAADAGRMESALNALACAHAVIVELGHIGACAERTAGVSAV